MREDVEMETYNIAEIRVGPNPGLFEPSVLHAIQSLINIRWDGLDFCAQLLLYFVHVEAIFHRDKIDC